MLKAGFLPPSFLLFLLHLACPPPTVPTARGGGRKSNLKSNGGIKQPTARPTTHFPPDSQLTDVREYNMNPTEHSEVPAVLAPPVTKSQRKTYSNKDCSPPGPPPNDVPTTHVDPSLPSSKEHPPVLRRKLPRTHPNWSPPPKIHWLQLRSMLMGIPQKANQRERTYPVNSM